MTTTETKQPNRYVPTMDDDDEDIYCTEVDTDQWVSSSSEPEESSDTDDRDFIDDDDSDSDYVPPCCCNCEEK